MITKDVTAAELAAWKQLWLEHVAELHENRIDGTALDAYFREKYQPEATAPEAFFEAVRLNAEALLPPGKASDVAAYTLPGGIFAGIDKVSGYFQVECEEIERAVPVWDDLFLRRGLNRQDLANYVVTGQYLQLRAVQQ